MKNNFLYSGLLCLVISSCTKENALQTETIPDKDGFTASKTQAMIIGDAADVKTTTLGGCVLMGGGADVNNAFKWMLQRSGGGDIVVIRSFGDDAYNEYLYKLYPVNSVETIIIDSRGKANDTRIADKIKNAEALFISGGDQWEYVKYWKGTKANEAINYLVNTKKVTIGGTSAGCAILGNICFDARNGTVTSQQVLNDPYNRKVSFTTDFIDIPVLKNIITDTHYNNPDRRGRQTGFMARLFTDENIAVKGIGVEESTAVCIDENGEAKVFGNNKAYFLKANTEKGKPELCAAGKALTWNKNKMAVSVYIINARPAGYGSADIMHFNNFSGGKYQYFSVTNGEFFVRQ